MENKHYWAKAKWTKVLLCILIAVLSLTLGARILSSNTIEKPVESNLETSRNEVIGLTTASTVASVAITVIPGDVGTPIADKLADLSGYFVAILAAIYIEKFLFGFMTFFLPVILVPFSCALLAFYFFKQGSGEGPGLEGSVIEAVDLDENRLEGPGSRDETGRRFVVDDFAQEGPGSSGGSDEKYDIIPYEQPEKAGILKRIAVKALLLGIAFYLIVPASAGVCRAVEYSYHQSISDTIEEAENQSSSLQESAGQASDEDGNIIEKAFNKITGGVSGIIDKFEKLLSSFIEAVAVLLVTSCVIPIAVLLFLIWLVKAVTGIVIPVKTPGHMGSRVLHKGTRYFMLRRKNFSGK